MEPLAGVCYVALASIAARRSCACMFVLRRQAEALPKECRVEHLPRSPSLRESGQHSEPRATKASRLPSSPLCGHPDDYAPKCMHMVASSWQKCKMGLCGSPLFAVPRPPRGCIHLALELVFYAALRPKTVVGRGLSRNQHVHPDAHLRCGGRVGRPPRTPPGPVGKARTHARAPSPHEGAATRAARRLSMAPGHEPPQPVPIPKTPTAPAACEEDCHERLREGNSAGEAVGWMGHWRHQCRAGTSRPGTGGAGGPHLPQHGSIHTHRRSDASPAATARSQAGGPTVLVVRVRATGACEILRGPRWLTAGWLRTRPGPTCKVRQAQQHCNRQPRQPMARVRRKPGTAQKRWMRWRSRQHGGHGRSHIAE